MDRMRNRSIVVDNNGIIAAVGPAAEIAEQFKDAKFEKEIADAGIHTDTVSPKLLPNYTNQKSI